jgi:hypothetical protein
LNTAFKTQAILFPSGLLTYVNFSSLPCVIRVRPHYSPPLRHPADVSRRVQMVNSSLCRFLNFCSFFLSLMIKYSPQLYVLHVTHISNYRRGFGLGDSIYCALYIYKIWGYRQLQCYRYFTHFTVHRCTRTRFLSLH